MSFDLAIVKGSERSQMSSMRDIRRIAYCLAIYE